MKVGVRLKSEHLFAKGQMMLLPGEELLANAENVQSLSAEVDRQGALWVTNIRVVWKSGDEVRRPVLLSAHPLPASAVHSQPLARTTMQENLNISVPYLLMDSVTTREVPHGPDHAKIPVLNIKTRELNLGFTMPTLEAFDTIVSVDPPPVL